MLPTGPLRLVICEDCEDIAELLSMALQDMGHDVTVVQTGVDAIEAILRIQPHVALLDIGLPDMNGCDVARAVRRDLGSKTRLVALTGYGDE